MQAVILAGGLGTRLRPITYEIPKPLVPVKKRPILNHHIAFLTKGGASEIAVIINKEHEDDYKRWQKTWSDEPWMPLVYIAHETERRGTFGGLSAVKTWLKPEMFLMSNGDSLMDFDLPGFIASHKKFGVQVTTALVATTDSHEYGHAVLDGDHVRHFTKDPEEEHSGFISAGFYAIEPEVLQLLTPSGEQSMEKDILTALALQKQNAGAIMQPSRFFECGTIPRWEEAIKQW